MRLVSTVSLFTLELAVFAGLFIFFSLPFTKDKLASRNFYRFSLLAVLAVQIVSAAVMKYQVGDVGLFSSVGAYLRQGADFYSYDVNHTHFPFLPFLIFLHAPLNLIAETFNTFTFSFYLKLILLIPLYGLSFLALKENNKPLEKGRQLQLQLLTVPVTFAVVMFHGQIDVMVIGFFALAALLLLKKNINLRNVILSGVAFGASVAVKTWSIFLLPIILLKIKKWEQRLIYLIAIGGFIFVDIFIYTRLVGSAFRTVVPALLSAGGGIAYWGYSYIIHLTPFNAFYQNLNNIYVFIPTFLIGLSLVLYKKFPFWKTAFLAILVLYVLLTRWGIQYIFWIYPFMFMVDRYLESREKYAFIALTSPYVLLAYWNDITEQKNGRSSNRLVLWIYNLVILHLLAFSKREEMGKR